MTPTPTPTPPRTRPALHTAFGLGRVTAFVAVILLSGTDHAFGRGYTDPPPRHSGHPATVTALGAHTPEMRRAVQRALLTGTPGLRVTPIPVHPEPVAP